MKITFTIVLSFIITLCLNAQDNIGLTFSQSFSTFRFVDSQNNKDDLDYSIKYGYGVSFQKIFGKVIFVEGLFSYNNKGASSTLVLEKLDWSFHYVNVGVNVGYKLNINRIRPQFGVGLYYGRLLQADQYIGSEYYDLMQTGNIKKDDFGFNLIAGMEYKYSDNGSVFLRLNEAMGLMQLEEGADITQKMFNRTFSIQLGLLFSIK
jgi:opacity protein-like surface antigen